MNSDGGAADETTSYGLPPPTQVAPPPSGPDGGEGRLLGGRYRLAVKLGHGGMGTVWRAHDEVVDRAVAVKESRLPEGVAEERRAMLHLRMQREARAAARIDHPNVVTVYDVVIEDGRPWLVMELVRGESLAEVLETGTIESREAARIGLAVLDALAAAHEAGVLHRDVKPANVMLGRHERVVLTDFGIAQMEGEQGLTTTGAFVGSLEYTAPERAAGQRPGPESDLFSLGVLLYAAVEGVSPFRRTNSGATLQALMSADPQPPVRAPGPLGELVMRLLAKRPADRPRPEEIRRILKEVIAAPPVDATVAATRLAGTGTLSLRAGISSPRRRRRRALLAGAVAAVVLATTLVLAPFSPASPFGDGDDASALPEGWRAHKEEDFRMTIAVPEGFQRFVDDEDGKVGYESPDGIYGVYVWSWDEEEDRRPLQVAVETLDGFREDTSYEDVDGDWKDTVFQEREAAELWVNARDAYAAEDDDHLTRRRSLFYGEQGGDQLWQVQVNMPGERGAARAYGEQLYADIIEHLEIHDGSTGESPGESPGESANGSGDESS
ncbi:serine/threonine-protein kinase [Streptomyces sp. 6N223]|uniref:serine/threonine-protein kinase n=1 Tax=Streptomyces sp. 6N223 TaxID=3457412 RepID=UPI003FD44654